jgi:hypothetical protein
MNDIRLDDRKIGQFVRHQLNVGLTQLDKPIIASLHDARQAALARAFTPQFSLAAAGRHSLVWCEGHMRPFLMALALAVAIVCGNYLMSAQRLDDLEDVDSALLSDDLPIDAYLDKGFHSWLAADSSSQR